MNEIRCNTAADSKELVDEDIPVVTKVSYTHPDFETRSYAVERCHHKEDFDDPNNILKECKRISQWFPKCKGSCTRNWYYEDHLSIDKMDTNGLSVQLEVTEDQFNNVDHHLDVQPILYFRLVAKSRDDDDEDMGDQTVVGEWQVRERMLAECRGELEPLTTTSIMAVESTTTRTTTLMTAAATTTLPKTTEGSRETRILSY